MAFSALDAAYEIDASPLCVVHQVCEKVGKNKLCVVVELFAAFFAEGIFEQSCFCRHGAFSVGDWLRHNAPAGASSSRTALRMTRAFAMTSRVESNISSDGKHLSSGTASSSPRTSIRSSMWRSAIM